jgi:signal transduction histidine kinase
VESPQKIFEDRKSLISFFIRCLFAILAAFFISKINLDYFESLLYDLRITYRIPPRLTNEVKLVLVTPETLAINKGSPGFKEHAEFLNQLSQFNPSAVVYVISIQDLKGSEDDKLAFANATKKIPNFFYATEDLEVKAGLDKIRFAEPLHKINVLPGPKTSDSNKLAKDGVTRRLVLQFQGQTFLHPQVAAIKNPEILDLNNIQGKFSLYESDQAFINYQPIGRFKKYNFHDLQDANKINLQDLENKIVIVGLDTNVDAKDYATTPMERNLNIMTAAEVHANMVETLITNSSPIKAADWVNLLIMSVLSIITVYVVLLLKPLTGILLLASTTVIFSIFSYLVFWLFCYWLDMAHVYLTIFLCYYFFIPYRLIVENRRSWEYYQKHKLLSEVELLKTNFIGMMSHDLKTPLARIQGMTELISNDKNTLSSPQREALDMIKQSSEDLTKFITTILNYAKIESQGVELHLKSKDLNELVKEVVRKHEFLAKIKHIKINCELEPLFSILIDPDLIKQVISNLVENAIKYSPENSKILILTEEKESKAILQISDQGIGIPADELPHIFMKFFRSQNAKSSPIKGSGLGLYLAKYFVELHGGQIFVESTPGQGSTFTVELPIKS